MRWARILLCSAVVLMLNVPVPSGAQQAGIVKDATLLGYEIGKDSFGKLLEELGEPAGDDVLPLVYEINDGKLRFIVQPGCGGLISWARLTAIPADDNAPEGSAPLKVEMSEEKLRSGLGICLGDGIEKVTAILGEPSERVETGQRAELIYHWRAADRKPGMSPPFKARYLFWNGELREISLNSNCWGIKP